MKKTSSYCKFIQDPTNLQNEQKTGKMYAITERKKKRRKKKSSVTNYLQNIQVKNEKR